jgi:hypothetical protein
MHGPEPCPLAVSRRAILADMGLSIGGMALGSLLGGTASGATPSASRTLDPLAPKPPHFAARAKSVILLYTAGGVSQLDLFDPKPKLREHDGRPVPAELVEGQRFSFLRGRPNLLGSPYRFQSHGESGMVFSELLPNLATVADRTTLVRSVHTDHVNHSPAAYLFFTGHQLGGRPSMGSWAAYGLGCETRDLPAFVQLLSGEALLNGKRFAGAGFLPGMDRTDRRATIDAINGLNAERLAAVGDPEIATRIAQYEMAFRMQRAAPELIDLSSESRGTLAMYGAHEGEPSLAVNLLQARRLVERGVRFVQVFDGGWDHHSKLYKELPTKCRRLDRPLAALVRDLAQRGMLEDTLVIWTGEFGRTPMLEGAADRDTVGRDHHKDAFTVWMAGGGLQPGLTLGATCELGYRITEAPVHVHDLQATVLHLLGIDHERLTFRHQGRDFRLTDVSGRVVHDLLG